MKRIAVCACLVPLGIAFAQQATDKPAFEVTSIKPYDPGSSEQMWTGMLTVIHVERMPTAN